MIRHYLFRRRVRRVLLARRSLLAEQTIRARTGSGLTAWAMDPIAWTTRGNLEAVARTGGATGRLRRNTERIERLAYGKGTRTPLAALERN